MFRGLPSPGALRTFESAARLGSFKRAAAELSVTPTAVSHQIRALEDTLGVQLFVRRTRQIDLTEIGSALAPALTRGFQEMKTAFDEVLATDPVITVSTTAAFALLRLVPELPSFYAQAPGMRVQIETATHPIDLRHDRHVDVALRYGSGPYPGLFALPLVEEAFSAYAAPGRIDNDARLSGATLLETDWQQPVLGDVNWPSWFARAQLEIDDIARIVRFDEEHFVLQAAIAGQGVALASSVLASDMVARGLLVPVRPDVHLEGSAYTALCLEENSRSRNVETFLAWLETRFS